MKTAAAFVLLLASAMPASARVAVQQASTRPSLVDVVIGNERLSVAVAALRPYLSQPVLLAVRRDPVVTFRASRIPPDRALRTLAALAGVTIRTDGGKFVVEELVTPSSTASVTLDVKDEDVRVVLQSMQKQCGIVNLVLDRDVQGSGTFLFRDLPCRQAFDTVLRTTGLELIDYSGSVVGVGRRR
ncbi:MAG: hypothetical protein ABI837_16660 [Acidobacteriota bacterium]